jgi:hypothetical protein
MMSRNVELEERIEALEQERRELGIEQVARSAVRAADAAEAAMAAEAREAGTVRYVVPRLEVNVAGLVGRRDEGIGLRFPGVEERADANTMSRFSLAIAHVPLRVTASSFLRPALEAIQAAAAGWEREEGGTAALGLAAQATRLLEVSMTASEEEVALAIVPLVEASAAFVRSAAPAMAGDTRKRVESAVRRLTGLSEEVRATGQASAEAVREIAGALAELGAAIEAAGRR